MISGAPQVKKEHYYTARYLNFGRWMNYWHQVDSIRRLGERAVLEIGLGNGTVRDALEKLGFVITTLDIDRSLNPDVVGSATEIPLPDNSFGTVLAAEILEHLPWNEFGRALDEIRRVTKRYAVISLPHSGYEFSFIVKIPLFARKKIIFKIPHFWKTHIFNGEHYWELGKKGFPVRRIKKVMVGHGFVIKESHLYADDPPHYFFLLERK